ncbi:MAG: hypothetical protein EPO68_03785 [Planctomycetota bacterium]|nr:MAG: hypothetical protein EPO68_03785 [Planctomycetota bacterium]
MPINVEVVTVAHIHGVASDVTVNKNLDANGNVDAPHHTGLVRDPLERSFGSVYNASATVATGTEAECRALALATVHASLGAGFSIAANAMPTSGLHIWVPREGWVIIDETEGLSFAFQLQVDTPFGPVDVKSLAQLNGKLISTDTLVVVQSY